MEISNKYQEFRIEHQESNVEMLLISLPPFGLWLDGLCLLHFFLKSYSTLKPSCNDIYSIEFFLLFSTEAQNCFLLNHLHIMYFYGKSVKSSVQKLLTNSAKQEIVCEE